MGRPCGVGDAAPDPGDVEWLEFIENVVIWPEIGGLWGRCGRAVHLMACRLDKILRLQSIVIHGFVALR